MLLCTHSAQAQYTSGVDGTVTDPSGAVVPNATVTIHNVETAATQSVQTTNQGYYRFTGLPAATYSIKANAPGFETLLRENIRLEVAATSTVNLALQIGAAVSQVTVTEAPPQIQTADASVSGEIGQREVQELPLTGRNFYSLVVLTPGVTGLPSGGGQAYAQATADIFNVEYSVNLNASGMRTESNSFLIDSAPVNSGPRRGVVNIDPNAESVQELRVAVNNYDAEYGGNAGALTNVITKQGANKFHGSLDEFHTDNDLQARSYFQSAVPVFRKNEFGGSIGGPIWKDHTFFFASVDALRSGVASGSSQTVITPDFINYLNTNYPHNISTYLLTTYPASISATSNINTVADMTTTSTSNPCATSSTAPTSLGQLPCSLPVTGSGFFAVTSPRNGLQWNARVDHSLHNGHDRIYANVYRTTLDQTNASVYQAFSVGAPSHTFYGNVAESHIFSSNILNEVRYSYTRVYGIDDCANCQIPGITISGTNGFGDGFGPFPFIQNNYEGADMLSWNKGAHNLKFGGSLQRVESNANGIDAFQRPGFYFQSVFDFAADKAFSEYNLAINPVTGKIEGAYYNDRRQFANLFVQDDWKVLSNLTINLGLRWETFGNFNEASKDATNIVFQGGNDFSSQIANAKVDVLPEVLKHNLDHNFGPRFGFAYDPTGKGRMVIRGGFGLFYDIPSDQIYPPGPSNPPVLAFASLSVQTPPYVPVYGLGSSANPPYGFPVPTFQTGLDSKNGLIGGKAGLTVMDPNMRVEYSENWSLGVQYALPAGWVAEANYIGSAGHHEYAQYDVNRFDGDLIQNKNVLTRLNSSFGAIEYAQANLNSSYSGGTVAVRNRGVHGLSTQIAYTLGKVIDQASSSGGGLNIVNVTDLNRERGLADFDVRQKLAVSLLYNIPMLSSGSNLLKTLTGGWEIGDITILQSGTPFSVYCSAPFSPVLDGSGNVIGNTGCDYNADGWDYDRPMTPAFGNTIKGASRSRYVSGLFDCAIGLCGNVFASPGLGSEGTLGRNTFFNPGYADSDISLLKNTKVPWFTGADHRANLQFRVDAYNAFNRVNLTGVVGDIANPQIGKSTSTYAPRDFQFGLRLTF